MIKDFIYRLRRKLVTLLPMLVGGGVVSLVLYGVVWLLTAWGPMEVIQNLVSHDLVASKEALRLYFLSYGDGAAAVFLAVQFLQVLLAPIPGQLTGLLGGFLFGFWPGLLLTMVGLTMGSWVAIVLSRWIGTHVVRRFVPPGVMIRFDYLLARGNLFDFFIIFLLPALPDDAICFLAGLTRLPVWQLVVVCLLGRLPGMAVLTFAGSALEQDVLVAQGIFALAMGAAVMLWLYDDKVEAWVSRRRA